MRAGFFFVVIALIAVLDFGNTASSNSSSFYNRHTTTRLTGFDHDNAKKLAQEAERLHERVSSFIGRESPQPIQVYLTNGSTGQSLAHTNSRTEEINIILSEESRLRSSELLAHGLTHVLAGVAHARNALLEEGLATYIGWNFSQSAEPASSDQDSIHSFVREISKRRSVRLPSIELISFSRRSFRNRSRKTSESIFRNLSYLMSGSFIGYLIEVYGIDKVMRVYDTGRYNAYLGKEMNELAVDWRSAIEIDDQKPSAEELVPGAIQYTKTGAFVRPAKITSKAYSELADSSDEYICRQMIIWELLVYTANYVRRANEIRRDLDIEIDRRNLSNRVCVDVLNPN